MEGDNSWQLLPCLSLSVKSKCQNLANSSICMQDLAILKLFDHVESERETERGVLSLEIESQLE